MESSNTRPWNLQCLSGLTSASATEPCHSVCVCTLILFLSLSLLGATKGPVFYRNLRLALATTSDHPVSDNRHRDHPLLFPPFYSGSEPAQNPNRVLRFFRRLRVAPVHNHCRCALPR